MSIYQKIGILLIILLLISPVLTYIFAFHSFKISNQPSEWGTFGDFIGGVINPLIALLTLLVTIYIAIEISKLEDKRSEKTIDFEKRRFLNELRESEYRRITYELQEVSNAVAEKKGSDQIFRALLHIGHFQIYNSHLFPFILDAELSTLIDLLSKLQLQISDSNTKTELLKKTFKDYLNATKVFSQKNQTYIIQEM